MKIATIAGLMAGSAIGMAVGAGMMMMPQSKQMKRAMLRSVDTFRKAMG